MRLLVRVVSIGALFSCLGCERAEKVVVQREWTANAEFAGDVWASKLASSYGITLDVREGSELIDPIKMVRSGEAQFGVASADRILQENEGGAELVVIATATFASPVVFVTKLESKINSPQDLIGRTIGIQPGTNTELVFQALAESQKIASTDVKIVDSGWGTQLFETGVIDVLGAFAYDEPIRLQMKNIQMGRTLLPAEYGVQYIGTVYFARKTLVVQQPALVQKFVNVLVEGWSKALSQPKEALDLLSEKYESVRNEDVKERRSFDAGRDYFKGENGYLLYASQQRWEEMARSLKHLGKLKSFDFNASVDYRFLSKATGR